MGRIPRVCAQIGALLVGLLMGMGGQAVALEKKGYQRAETGGYLYFGYFFHNPTFAARPDNSGLVLMRYGLHLDVQPWDWATISYDSNFFSDKQAENTLRPSEWDNHLAVAGRWKALELSLHAERDAPADRGGLVQSYAEVQGRLLWTLADLAPTLAARFPQQELGGFVAVGNLFATDHYFARPDNTGSALLRYVGHLDLTFWQQGDFKVFAGLDANVFTDRQGGHPFRPSELDFITTLGGRWRDWELVLMRESDMPVDRGGLTQSYYAVMLRWYFTVPWLTRTASQ